MDYQKLKEAANDWYSYSTYMTNSTRYWTPLEHDYDNLLNFLKLINTFIILSTLNIFLICKQYKLLKFKYSLLYTVKWENAPAFIP